MNRAALNFSNLAYILSRIQKKMTMSSIYGSSIDPTAKIEPGSQVVNSVFGRHSFCGYYCAIINAEIGSFCSIAQNVSIGGSAHPAHFVSTSPAFLSHRDSIETKFARHHYYDQPRTTIGSDVWIGGGAMIKAGVNIGHGSIVGMGAIVTRDVPPHTIVGGNPARVIRERFTKSVSEAILKSEWWNMGDEDLRKYGAFFDNPEMFLEKIGEQ